MNLQAGQSFTVNVTLEEGNDPEPAFMLGRVHSSNNGDGISYAQVSAYSYNTGNTYGAEADDSGYYDMGDLIGEQEYEIMASADGYTSLMETHYLGSGDSLYLDFYLDQAPQSGMFGFVQNSNGEPLSEVNIYPTLNGNDYYWAATDDSGYYNVQLPAGSYSASTGINNYYASNMITTIGIDSLNSFAGILDETLSYSIFADTSGFIFGVAVPDPPSILSSIPIEILGEDDRIDYFDRAMEFLVDTTLAISNETLIPKKPAITFYPNPFNTQGIIQIFGKPGKYHLTLYNILGQTAWEKKIQLSQSDGLSLHLPEFLAKRISACLLYTSPSPRDS